METRMFPFRISLALPLPWWRAKAEPKNIVEDREADPREVQRMRDELRLARERVRMQVTGGRWLW